MLFIKDSLVWMLFWLFIISGAARAAFDGAFFAYFRPQWEAMIRELPQWALWLLGI